MLFYSQKDLTPAQERALLDLEGPFSDKTRDIKGVRGFDYYLISMSFICTDSWFIYYLFYCTISVIGLVIHPIYISFLLIDFAVRFDMLKSITKNRKTLGMTMILIIIILFIYGSFAFFFLFDMFYTYGINSYDSEAAGESFCGNMIQCWIVVANFGIRAGGGIGDWIKNDDVLERFDLFFYTFSFKITIVLVMLNIVFGIIIDTFAQLRSEKKSIESDQGNKCYVCNLDRYIFDQDGNGFEDHVVNDHNMWNYIFYIVHLKAKDPTEYNGVESYVWGKYDKDDTSWIPQHKAMIIDGNDGEMNVQNEEAKMTQKLEDLYEKLKVISKRMNKNK